MQTHTQTPLVSVISASVQDLMPCANFLRFLHVISPVCTHHTFSREIQVLRTQNYEKVGSKVEYVGFNFICLSVICSQQFAVRDINIYLEQQFANYII